MCVTNTTYRRSQPISLTDAQQQQQPGAFASGLTQRLSAAAASQQQQQNARFFSAMPQLSAEFSIAPPTEKPRPTRRRKPQKPGKTAKMNDRHFVVHSYHDHSNDPVDSSGAAADEDHYYLSKCTSAAQHEEDYYEPSQQQHRRKGGVAIAFPLKLHAVLDQVEADGLSHVISWMPHGRCFVIHQPKEFVDHVMPKYFRQTKLTSFQRQLNLYGFCRLTRGPDASGYYHELFLRNKTHLCKQMTRTKVKGTKFKAASSPEQEPDFYTMPPVNSTVTPSNTSDDEEVSHDDSPSSPPSSAMCSSMPQTSFYQPHLLQMQQQQSLFEPLPIQFLPMAAASSAPMLSMPTFSSWPLSMNDEEADQVLDEAVEELFMSSSDSVNGGGGATSGDDLVDFVEDWDPDNNDFCQVLENDKQLGYMLEKLLED